MNGLSATDLGKRLRLARERTRAYFDLVEPLRAYRLRHHERRAFAVATERNRPGRRQP